MLSVCLFLISLVWNAVELSFRYELKIVSFNTMSRYLEILLFCWCISFGCEFLLLSFLNTSFVSFLRLHSLYIISMSMTIVIFYSLLDLFLANIQKSYFRKTFLSELRDLASNLYVSVVGFGNDLLILCACVWFITTKLNRSQIRSVINNNLAGIKVPLPDPSSSAEHLEKLRQIKSLFDYYQNKPSFLLLNYLISIGIFLVYHQDLKSCMSKISVFTQVSDKSNYTNLYNQINDSVVSDLK